MKQKQREMDEIIEKIHKTIIQQDSNDFKEHSPNQLQRIKTLFVICGDHGMNEVILSFQ
jgi:hypothetical protein